MARTQVRDLSPLAGLPLIELKCNADIVIDATLLRSIPTLQKINDIPVTEIAAEAGSTGLK